MFFKRNKFWFNLHLALTFIYLIPLSILAISGAIISYHDEIMDAVNGSISHISHLDNIHKDINTTGSQIMDSKHASTSFLQRLNTDEIMLNLSQTLPNFMLTYYQIFSDENKSFKVFGLWQDEKQPKSLFIDPFFGEILGEDKGSVLISLMLNLHTNLGLSFFGEKGIIIGKQIIALTNISLILLLISGAILYYPSIKKRLISAFIVKFNFHGYGFIRSLHSALGSWAFLFLFLISITGLYFSYDLIMSAVNRAFGEKQIFRKSMLGVRGILLNNENIAKLNIAVEIFHNLRGKDYEFATFSPISKGDKFIVFYIDKGDDEINANLMQIDVITYQIISHIRADSGLFVNGEMQKYTATSENSTKKEQSKAFLISKFMLNLHSGYLFGEVGKFVFCIASLLVFVFVITGIIMSIKRVFIKKKP